MVSETVIIKLFLARILSKLDDEARELLMSSDDDEIDNELKLKIEALVNRQPSPAPEVIPQDEVKVNLTDFSYY